MLTIKQLFPLFFDLDLEEILNLRLGVTLDLGKLSGGLHGEHIKILLEGVKVVAPLSMSGEILASSIMSSRIISAARSASIIVGALVFAEVMLGKAEASHTRSPSIP